jgi:beta-ureidopropionase / N-carbamoyl-L-amino-acid hydrolase
MQSQPMPSAVAPYVSPGRLLALIEELACFGKRADGGVDRQALTAADIEARSFLAQRARALGCTVTRDPAGNMFFRRAGMTARPPIATGSHIDTQPAGGKLDGAYGVCAGLEAIAALNDAGLITRYPVEAVVWSNEEGCRFAPGSLGSMAHAAPASFAALSAARDATGASYAEGIARLDAALPDVPLVPLGRTLGRFIEAHIEQGPVLEARGIPIGIVTAVQGVRWFRVTANGAAAHAGTTPVRYRHDALRALTPLLGSLYAGADRDDTLRVTIGTIAVEPSSINTVPGQASITVDVRHVEPGPLDAIEAMIRGWCAEPRFGCVLACERLMALDTTAFDPTLADALRRAAAGLDLACLDMISGAFHDAVHLAPLCPTAMLFVPSRGGISHNPAEHTDAGMLVDGTRVLVDTLAELAESVGS